MGHRDDDNVEGDSEAEEGEDEAAERRGVLQSELAKVY